MRGADGAASVEWSLQAGRGVSLEASRIAFAMERARSAGRLDGGRMRLLKIAGWVLASLLVLVIALGFALWLGGGPALAWIVRHPASAAIGREIRIDGPVSVKWGAPTRI